MPAARSGSLSDQSDSALARHILAAIDELSSRGTHESFSAMLDVSAHAGLRVGDAARALAESSSWRDVGEASGTTKQAAWSRWRG